MGNPRKTAVEALWKLHRQDGYSNLVIDRAMEKNDLEPRDRGLAATLFYGVLERQITLDYIIEKFSSRSLARLPLLVVEILRAGVYQLYFMKKIPPSAAVDESVTLAGIMGEREHQGFINALLRTVVREQKNLRYPDANNNEPRFLEVKYSCPQALIRLWRKSYGTSHCMGLLQSLNGRPPLLIRTNTVKTTPEALQERLQEEGMEVRISPVLPEALAVEGVTSIEKSVAYREGLFHVQDLASQLCCAALDPQPGERIYDICAAPGGKSFTSAQRMNNTGALYAFDHYSHKVSLIRAGAHRLGLDCLTAEERDALKDTPAMPVADRVLCDLPCSGLGAIRRKPEIRYKPLTQFDELPALQLSILNKTAQLVKPGGQLLYSTCTLNPQENDGVVQAFLAAHPDFEPRPLALPSGMERAIDEPTHMWTLFPHVHGTDGFYFASFGKRR